MKVLDSKNLTNYSEGLLRALLLRLVRSHEWGESKRLALSRQFSEFAKQDDQDVLLGELLLAMARGSVAPVDPGFFGAIYGPVLGEHREYFQQALKLAPAEAPAT